MTTSKSGTSRPRAAASGNAGATPDSAQLRDYGLGTDSVPGPAGQPTTEQRVTPEMLEDVRAQLAALQAQASRQAAQPPAPAKAEEPDVLGLPGVKPLRIAVGAPLPTTRHPLFYIGAKAFTVPDVVPMRIAAEFVHLAGTGTAGEFSATDFLLTELLGAEDYAAMRASDELTRDHYAWVVTMCTRLALGALETPKAS